MIRFLYNLLFPVALLLFLPGYLRKARRRGNYRANFGERFARYDRETCARLAARSHTWIHAVSVGEVGVALKLIAQLRALDSQFRCVLTTTTPTGHVIAQAQASDSLIALYNPLDAWPVMRRAFRQIRPERIVLVEAEVWPNLAAEARRRRVPVALVNARLSNRSERRFRRFAALVRPTFGCLDLVCVQEPRDVARWEALGVRPAVIHQTGSIKYDPENAESDAEIPLGVLRTLGLESSRPIVLGGSTHPGEEEILARAFLQIRSEVPEALLILAPRHVERALEIGTTLRGVGLHLISRKEGDARERGDGLLLDTTGELRDWYAVATVVFIGKSLASHGGQNPVEPIVAGKPVVFGPHMENFASLARALITSGGAVQVATAAELPEALLRLLRSPAQRAALVAQAREVIAVHRGATARTAELVLGCKSLAPP